MTTEPPGDPGSFMTAGDGVISGSRIAGYRLTGRIGRGGMAVVFRAEDERLGRVVALKVLTPVLAEDEAFRQRFIRESRAAAAVDDPHIIPVFEAGEADGVLFIAMRYVPGGDVRSLLRSAGPLSALRAASVVSPVAAALDAAHAAGLVHRDVKPANMLIDARPGRPDHVYLSDFGLSKGSLSSVGLTGSGLFLGTPDYVSPEQIDGRPVDGRADQYALACAAFEMLSGEPPFARDHGMAVIYAHTSAPPPALTARQPTLPAPVDAVFTRALAKDPADRYGSCQEFAESLREALGVGPYAIAAASGDQERSAMVVVPGAVAGAAAEAGSTSSGSRDAASAAAGLPNDQAEGVGGFADDETVTRAPLGAGVQREGAIISPARRSAGQPVPRPAADGDNQGSHQVTASAGLPALVSGPAPGKRRPRTLLVLGAVTVILAGAVIGTVSALNNPANGTHGPPGPSAVRGLNSSPAASASPANSTHERSSHEANALGPMTPIPSGQFNSVITGPGPSVWAFGGIVDNGGDQPLIERWDGTAWSRVPAPSIHGAYIDSATSGPGGTMWAVGSACPTSCTLAGNGYQTLVLHWDGAAWSRTPSPTPGAGAELFSVAAGSNGTAWAFGTCTTCGGTYETLILHWNGNVWTQVPNSGDVSVDAAASEPDGTFWGVGYPTLRLTGTTLAQVPVPGVVWGLNSVSAGPGATPWAVGSTCSACGSSQERHQTVVLHWDGAKWSQVPSPSPATISILNSVSTGPGGTAWAVGYYCGPVCESGYDTFYGHTLILHWNGTAWTQIPSPNPGDIDTLSAVADTSDGSAWAAGSTCLSQCRTSSATFQTLILRWNGAAWVPG